MTSTTRFLSALALALSLATFTTASAEQRTLLVKPGEKIAFMGDSITAGGVRKDGYVTLAMEALNKEGLALTTIPAGRSGNRSKDMHAALKQIPDQEGKARMFGEPKYDRKIKNKLTTDGCHMNTLGNIMMAKGVLRTFGLSEVKIAAAEKEWLGK